MTRTLTPDESRMYQAAWALVLDGRTLDAARRFWALGLLLQPTVDEGYATCDVSDEDRPFVESLMRTESDIRYLLTLGLDGCKQKLRELDESWRASLESFKLHSEQCIEACRLQTQSFEALALLCMKGKRQDLDQPLIADCDSWPPDLQ